ncbi:MAG: hypothetical protein HZA93_01555 [Verrucomicrobia bacterium]|nr:hypothetical protein [Verrucomicrobiota bacterium]
MKSHRDSAAALPALSRRLIAAAAPLAGLLLLGGCASSYEVKIDALAKPKAEEAISYQIRNKNTTAGDESLRYKEAAGYVRTALSGKGMYEAPDGTPADLVVELDYGVGPPQSKVETVSEPVYRVVPGRITTQSVQVGTDRNGRPIYQTVTVQEPPTTEFDGYREYQVRITVYEKYLKLSARENKPAAEGRPPTEVWAVDITSEGESKDVRKALPVLAAAGIDYVGKDSHGQKVVRIKDTNSDVAFVKKGM